MANQKRKIWLIFLLALLIFVGVLFAWKSEAKSPISADQITFASNQRINSEESIPEKDTKKTDDIAIPILMYHYIRVVDDQNDKLGVNLSINPNKFAEQLDYLTEKGYKTITLRDVASGNIPEKPVILTFDDGYHDFYSNAYPELKKRGMIAVSFVIAKKQSAEYMTAFQIKELSDAGIEIGSHTLTHPDLSTIKKSQVETEIIESKGMLENITGQAVISFCYPAGKYADETIEILKNSGYRYATTTKSGIGQFSDPLTLSRYRMNVNTDIKSYLK